MRLVFMGTPAFAVSSLRRLAASSHQVVAVVTNPDRPRGRGRVMAPPPVKEVALELGLEVLQPAALDEPSLAGRLAGCQPDLFAVVAFSILPRPLLELPRLGSVNLHPSLLPAYRGAAPIIWAVIRGERETGLSTLLLNPRVDAGDLLLQESVAIDPEETAGELEARLSPLGADLLLRTVDGLARGSIALQRQDQSRVSRAPKLQKEDGRLDWNQPTEALRNLIRGANPMPGAFTEWEGGLLKVHRSRPAAHRGEPGTVLLADPRQGLVVATGDGALLLTEVQPAGKPPMEGSAFVRGYPIQAGARLGR
ncbi:MAG: methionyl-tRNA formyltransferase [Candidatus Latescibacteria bacterium]|nr:methionyl-tRNA formyltransferase [Candidatus Latescibacterota bacterium]